MSDFKFLHVADLHLGSPFHGLALREEHVARRFARAGREAFTALIGRAIEEKVAFVVIAGDVFDGTWRDNTIGLYFNRELARLERAGIEVFLLKGNHDAESVVARSIPLPASVKSFGAEAPTTLKIDHLKVALHGQSFAHRAVTDNLAIKYPHQVAGWFNIGVLHTALTGHPPHEPYAPATPGHLRARGYDYWALGHVHDFEILQSSPYIVYPGNLQGRNMRERGEKGGVLVRVEDSKVAAVDRIIVDRVRWLELKVDASAAPSEAALLKQVEDLGQSLADVAAERAVVARVVLAGDTPLHRTLVAHRDQLTEAVQAALHRLHGDIWLERLEISTRMPRQRVRSDAAMRAIDLGALLDAVQPGEEFAQKAREQLSALRERMPGTVPALEQDLASELDRLIAEARDLLLTRAADEA
ncbi:MAG TPA: DNA repair exonuclease [Devosiaceae bacterium]|nr:DNA repair exonuclease [Devosiaceae bacterium]